MSKESEKELKKLDHAQSDQYIDSSIDQKTKERTVLMNPIN